MIKVNITNAKDNGSRWTGSGYYIAVKADAGFIFMEAPRCNYMSEYGYPSYEVMTVSTDKTEATTQITDIDQNEDIFVVGEVVPEASGKIEVTNEIGNGTVESHSYDGVTLKIAVKSTQYPRYRFVNPETTYTSTEGTQKTVPMQTTHTDNTNIADVSLTDCDVSQPLKVTGSYENVTHVETNFSNCLPENKLPEYFPKGAAVHVVLKANPKTEFNPEDAPRGYYYNDFGNLIQFQSVMSPDKKTATLDITLPSEYVSQEMGLSGAAFPVKVIGGKFGAVNVYEVNTDILDQFAKKRFFKVVDTDPETGMAVYHEIDLGTYVNRIKRIYAEVPDGSSDVLRCGNYNTEISVIQPDTDTLEFDFGEIKVPEYNFDALDFDSEINLFLPFKGFVSLSSKFVGKMLRLNYIINVLTGSGVARLTVDGTVIQVEEITPSQDVLYRSGNEELSLIGGDQWNELLFYGTEPYLYVKHYNSMNKSVRNKTCVTGKIGTFRGYSTIEDVNLITSSQMLADEQRMICDALSQGVRIEEPEPTEPVQQSQA